MTSQALANSSSSSWLTRLQLSFSSTLYPQLMMFSDAENTGNNDFLCPQTSGPFHRHCSHTHEVYMPCVPPVSLSVCMTGLKIIPIFIGVISHSMVFPVLVFEARALDVSDPLPQSLSPALHKLQCDQRKTCSLWEKKPHAMKKLKK